MIEETRIRMGLLYPNLLPIAITFDRKSSPSDFDFKWKDPSFIVAHAVCCRMMAAVYNIPMEEAHIRMKAALEGAGMNNEDCDDDLETVAENVIVGTVQHIAGRVKKLKPTVDSLVLFIDESAKLIEYSKYPQDASHILAHLRHTILGDIVGKVLKTSLVLSSLNAIVFGASETGRRVRPIKLASKLSVDHIVDNMWIPSLHVRSTEIKAVETSMLKWLAASVSAAPRLVLIMRESLQAELAATRAASSQAQGLSLKQSMGAVLSAFDRRRRVSCYADVRFPVGKYLYALINDKVVALDETALEYVRSSSFTNSITEFPHFETIQPHRSQLVPESALYLLAATSAVDAGDVIEREIQNEFKDIWTNLVHHVQLPLSSSPPGQPLEDVFARVLRMRILSTHLNEHSPGQTTLQDVLAIDDMSAIKYTVEAAPYKAAKISASGKTVVHEGVTKKIKQWEAHTFESGVQSYKSNEKKASLSQLLIRKILVPKVVRSLRSCSETECDNSVKAKTMDSTLELINPRPTVDHCTLMLLARMLPSSTIPSYPTEMDSPDEIVLVFEETSRRGEGEGWGEHNDRDQIWRGHFIQGKAGKEKGPYEQYGKFCQAVASITESDLEDDDQGGYQRALKEGRFLYVYVTTQGGPAVYLTAQDLPDTPSNSLGVLVLNRDMTRQILSATFCDVYEATRSAL